MSRPLIHSGCRVVSIIRFRLGARGHETAAGTPVAASGGSRSSSRGPVNTVVTLQRPDGSRLCCWMPDACCLDEPDAPVQFDKHYDVVGRIGRRGQFQGRAVTWLQAVSFHPPVQQRLL